MAPLPKINAPDFPDPLPRSGLPNLALHESVDRQTLDAAAMVTKWLQDMQKAVADKDAAQLEKLFVEEGWWRDIITLSWDTVSKYGPGSIAKYVLDSAVTLQDVLLMDTSDLGPRVEQMGPAAFLQCGFTFTTKHGSGRGLVRLASVGPDDWRAWTMYTELRQLKEVENPADSSLGDDEYQILGIGAGQAGLSFAAQCQHMGLKYLLIEQLPRIGDTWRIRYDAVKTHTPSYMDNFPFLHYPSNWPKNIPGQRVGDWMESYARILQLKALPGTTASNVRYDASTRKYTVDLETNGIKRTIKTRHIVMSMGLNSQDPLPMRGVTGQETFGGLRYHSVQHKSATLLPDVKNKSVTVIGAGTSGHDIAKDFVDAGAKEVRLVQRNPIVYVSQFTLETFLLPFWQPNSTRPVTETDLLEMSASAAVALTLTAMVGPMCADYDKEMHDGLEKAGMAIRRGTDGITLLDSLFCKNGHFYIEQGAGHMIVDGRIKVHQCKEGVKKYYEKGVELVDGTKIDSDVIVEATGFQKNGPRYEKLLGKEIADKLDSESWGALDDETERVCWWRPTPFPGLWNMPGFFSWARQYSGPLALQIDAVEKGANEAYYDSYKS